MPTSVRGWKCWPGGLPPTSSPEAARTGSASPRVDDPEVGRAKRLRRISSLDVPNCIIVFGRRWRLCMANSCSSNSRVSFITISAFSLMFAIGGACCCRNDALTMQQQLQYRYQLYLNSPESKPGAKRGKEWGDVAVVLGRIVYYKSQPITKEDVLHYLGSPDLSISTPAYDAFEYTSLEPGDDPRDPEINVVVFDKEGRVVQVGFRSDVDLTNWKPYKR